MEKLKQYVELLSQAEQNEKKRTGSNYISRVEATGACRTLWLPMRTSNRIATIDLNHTICGFDNDGQLWGENGNCGTMYKIIQVPSTHIDLELLGNTINNKLGNSYPNWYNVLRADNSQIIEQTINQLYS